MKLATLLPTLLALTTSTLADSSTPTSTLTIHPGCPSTTAPTNAMVTRSAVAVPSCAAGNDTKPMIISVSGDVTMTMTGGGGSMMMPSSSMSGRPAEFTGGAGRKGVAGGVVAVLGGVVAGLVV